MVRSGSVLWLLLAFAAGCSGGSEGASVAGAPEDARWRLAFELARAPRLAVEVAPGPAREHLRARAADLARAEGREVALVDPLAAPAGVPRWWIGSPRTPGAAQLSSALGVVFVDAAEGGGELRYEERAVTWVVATLADPRDARLPLQVALATDDEAAARAAGTLRPAALPGLRVGFAHGPPATRALEASGAARGPLLSALDAGWRRAERARSGGTVTTPIRPPEGSSAARPAAAESPAPRERRAMGRARALLGGVRAGTPPEPAQVVRHPTVASKERWLEDGRLSSRDPAALDVHVLDAFGPAFDGGAGAARAWALANHGVPAEAWLEEALGAACADAWWGVPMDAWRRHLLAAGVPPLEELLDARSRRSPHLLVPLRGAFLEAVVAHGGSEALRALWYGASAPGEDDAAVWSDYARALRGERVDAPEHAPRGPALAWSAARDAQRAAALARSARNGICLVQPAGDQRPWLVGFGGEACAQSLADARALGADAVSIVFESWLERPAPRHAGRPAARAEAGDLALFATARAARDLGFEVLLRPRVQASASGGPAAEALLGTLEQERALFEALADEVEHWALLAELAGADIFCIGGESPAAAVTLPFGPRPREAHLIPARRAGWIGVARRARSAFSGALTYAARDHGEVQGIEFWGELDFLGQDVFAELSAGPGAEPGARPRADQIGRQLRWHLERRLGGSAELFGKPALVTEIGLPSSAGAAAAPRVPGGALDLELQRRWYVGLGEALRWMGPEQTPAGLYLWSWSSDPRAGGPADAGFDPRGKAAVEVLRTRLWGRP